MTLSPLSLVDADGRPVTVAAVKGLREGLLVWSDRGSLIQVSPTRRGRVWVHEHRHELGTVTRSVRSIDLGEWLVAGRDDGHLIWSRNRRLSWSHRSSWADVAVHSGPVSHVACDPSGLALSASPIDGVKLSRADGWQTEVWRSSGLSAFDAASTFGPMVAGDARGNVFLRLPDRPPLHLLAEPDHGTVLAVHVEPQEAVVVAVFSDGLVVATTWAGERLVELGPGRPRLVARWVDGGLLAEVEPFTLGFQSARGRRVTLGELNGPLVWLGTAACWMFALDRTGQTWVVH